MTDSDVVFLSATELARRIRMKELSSVEVVEAHLRRIEQVNPVINAVCTLVPELALECARRADVRLVRGEVDGPLHGVPVTIKDSFDTAGIRTVAGVPGLEANIPAVNATAVSRLLNAGAIILGKTNTPPITFSYETNNPVFGPTRNPYNPERISGGSSGGEAAIIAAGGSPFGIGTDTAGSIRGPSNFCGTAGLKPTTGRVPRTGHVIGFGTIIDFFTVVGPMARRVEDLVLGLRILVGPDGYDPAIVPVPVMEPDPVHLKGLKLAFYTNDGVHFTTPEISATLRLAAQALAEAGMQVSEDCPQSLYGANELYTALFDYDQAEWVRDVLEHLGARNPAEALPYAYAAWPEPLLDAAGLTAVIARWDALRLQMAAFIRRYDLILAPVYVTPAPPHGHYNDLANWACLGYQRLYNMTGWPGVVVRCGTSPEGLPIGVQVIAGPYREDLALAAGMVLEQAFGGWQKPPL